MQTLHHRMPVIIGSTDYERWLDASADSKALLAPYPDEALTIEKA